MANERSFGGESARGERLTSGSHLYMCFLSVPAWTLTSENGSFGDLCKPVLRMVQIDVHAQRRFKFESHRLISGQDQHGAVCSRSARKELGRCLVWAEWRHFSLWECWSEKFFRVLDKQAPVKKHSALQCTHFHRFCPLVHAPSPSPTTTAIPHIEVGSKWMWILSATPKFNRMAPFVVDLCATLDVFLPHKIRRFCRGFFSSAVLGWRFEELSSHEAVLKATNSEPSTVSSSIFPPTNTITTMSNLTVQVGW